MAMVLGARIWTAAGLACIAVGCTIEVADTNGAPAESPRAPEEPTIVVAAGDLASAGDGDSLVAVQMARMRFAAFFTLGDHAYENGTAEQFAMYYQPVFGRFDSLTLPSPGNHDYYDRPRARGYRAYFSARAPAYPDSAIYYTFDLGGWRWFSLNSEVSATIHSAQYAWVERHLRARGLPRCFGAYWHRPVHSIGSTPPDAKMKPIWGLLARKGAVLVVNGHEHNYQRWRPIDGITQIIAGTGGASLYTPNRTDSRVVMWDAEHFGVLELTLWGDRAAYRWVVTSGVALDSGSVSCPDPGAAPR
jgi:hypothetical protein